MKREHVDQRCGCDRCALEGRSSAATRATCHRCHEGLLVTHWADQMPRAYGTCPACCFHGDLDLDVGSVTDMSALEETIAHA